MSTGAIKPNAPPPPEYAFGYHRAPRLGNTINGLGVSEQCQAEHVFHKPDNPRLDWLSLNRFFLMNLPWPSMRHFIVNLWLMRHEFGPVARKRVEVTDPAAQARDIKDQARAYGADLVGITALTEREICKGQSVPFPNAIIIGMPMDREEMQYVPQDRSLVEVMRVYKEVCRTAMKLARHIRSLGWAARGFGTPSSSAILHIPLAIKAGLGQLGKHGSMITVEHGSNVRLAAVLTDMPLAHDRPVDIGVDDVCMSCRRCVTDCPPDAIFNEKQMVRGDRKWYVDFDKCIPYFVKTNGCAICIEVCPWSVPGRGPRLSQQMLARRQSRRVD